MSKCETEWYIPSSAEDGQPGTSWSSHREKPTGDYELIIQVRIGADRAHLAECLYTLADAAEKGHRKGKAANDVLFEARSPCNPKRAAASMRALADIFDNGSGPL